MGTWLEPIEGREEASLWRKAGNMGGWRKLGQWHWTYPSQKMEKGVRAGSVKKEEAHIRSSSKDEGRLFFLTGGNTPTGLAAGL